MRRIYRSLFEVVSSFVLYFKLKIYICNCNSHDEPILSDEVGCVDPDKCFDICGSRAGCTNIAYPKLVLGIMPSGE